MKFAQIRYNDPVTLSDMEAEVEYAQEGQKIFSEFYYRLSAQSAPPDLIDEMSQLALLYKEAVERIEAIKLRFPKE